MTFATRPMTTIMSILTQGGKGLVFPPYGDQYLRQLCKICTMELLSNKRVQSFISIHEQEVNELVGKISSCSSNGQLVNLSEMVATTVNNSTVRAVIGSKCEEQDVFMRAFEKSAEIAAGFNLVDLYPSSWIVSLVSGTKREAHRCRSAMNRVIDGIIKQHRERKASEIEEERDTEDLVDVLLRIHDEGTLGNHFDIDSARAVIWDLIGAGSETSSTTLEWAISELIRNPRVMKTAQSQFRELLKGCEKISESDLVKLNYLHMVIKETLRLHPPATLLLPRQCHETCRISGYDIPKGATILMNVWAIGRDPKYWEDPEDFRPERFINNNLDFKGNDFEFPPFGAGRRMCPGMSIGLANVAISLASLLYNFDWRLPDGASLKKLTCQNHSESLLARKVP
ncbi:hypothetical protein LUZ60_004499 [Juncus effusus]|nr:hypothetical protein LUZ60_004499 [Juncus effusus]